MSSDVRGGESAPEGRKKLADGVSHRSRPSLVREPRKGAGREGLSALPPLPGLMRKKEPSSGGSRHRLISVVPPGPIRAFARRPTP